MTRAKTQCSHLAAATDAQDLAVLKDLLQRAQIEAFYLGLSFIAELIAIPLASLTNAEKRHTSG